MLNLIRQLRRDLLARNKLKVYLLYGLGEVLLVVIGILLALQIDNWNEERKETIELNNYLQNISNNITSDRQQIIDIKSFRDSVRLYANNITEIAYKDSITTADFMLLIHPEYNVFFDQYLAVNESGFEALKNSGYIGKIQNTRIESLLNEYYLTLHIVMKQEQSLNEFMENMEVLGFEQNAFPQAIDILREPDIHQYIQNHQPQIRALVKNPALFGANVRGSIVSELQKLYVKLISLGEEINLEIENILEK